MALRATIRARGTARVLPLPLTIVALAATAADSTLAISALVLLMTLVACFEAIYALHLVVKRVGGYLQVFHQGDDFGRAVFLRGRVFHPLSADERSEAGGTSRGLSRSCHEDSLVPPLSAFKIFAPDVS